MSGLPIVNFYALRIGASNVDGVGDFIDNQIPGLCVFVAECGDDCSITIVNIPNAGNFVYEDELFGIIASEIVSKMPLGSVPSVLAAGLLKSGYENDLDGLIDVDMSYEDTAFNADCSDDVSENSPCYFIVASVTNDVDEAFVDPKTGNVIHESENLESIGDLYGRIDESDSFVIGVPD
jgi:hypothetical protein